MTSSSHSNRSARSEDLFVSEKSALVPGSVATALVVASQEEEFPAETSEPVTEIVEEALQTVVEDRTEPVADTRLVVVQIVEVEAVALDETEDTALVVAVVAVVVELPAAERTSELAVCTVSNLLS